MVSRAKSQIKIAPSILSADFSSLGAEISSVERAGAELLHVDVMDGHFVPNITIGPVVVRGVRKSTSLPFDSHLMVMRPEKFIDAFVDAGSTGIIVHTEVLGIASLRRLRTKLHRAGVRLGISLNPATPFAKVEKSLEIVDMILVMSVNPGFGGQAFMPRVLSKIRKLRSVFEGDIAVDGGINRQTAPSVIRAGANILVAGSYIFGAHDRAKAITRLRNCS